MIVLKEDHMNFFQSLWYGSVAWNRELDNLHEPCNEGQDILMDFKLRPGISYLVV